MIFLSRADADQAVEYVTQIKPLLAEKCYPCHGRLKQESDMRLETRTLMLDAEVIVPGKPENSELLLRVMATDEQRMPPADDGAALKPDEIALLQTWISQGAPAPEESVPASPLQHWAFQKIERPVFLSTAVNPIDALLNEQRVAKSVKVQPEAERGILIRRLYLDLIGLPPSLEQLHDERPWEQIVDELLANPQHGERWGRHWMDVWRYSDWYGLGAQLRYSQKHIWHWRDWIIESLNEDKGYDQMIHEMLAADEIAPLDQNALRATGFLARNYYLFNRTTWLDSTIEHTGKAFLGLTLNCAKCHDHKYDPITHLDYYQMRAIFEPHQVRLDPIAGTTNFDQGGIPRVFDDHTQQQTYIHLRGNPKTLDKDTVVLPNAPEFLSTFQPPIESVTLPYEAYAPGARDYVQQDRLRDAIDNVQSAQTAVTKQATTKLAQAKLAHAEARLAAVTATIAADSARFRSQTDKQDAKQDGNLLAKAAAILQAQEQVATAKLNLEAAKNDKQKQAAAKQLKSAKKRLVSAQNGKTEYQPIRGAKKALETPAHKEPDYPATYAKVSTGRRTALAKWITSQENPLTARVAVNHVWMRHFGQPLVDSVFDFGLRAPEPIHAELLDFLAHEFMKSGWSFRHLHRLIVTSQTYRMSSSSVAADEATVQADPTNQLYWRMNTRRMESQVVRDSLLHLADELDSTMGGPSIDANGDSKRRSVYFKHSRDDKNKFLSMFNDADLFQCYRRSESIAPQQALALANSKLSFAMAEKIAQHIREIAGEPDLARDCVTACELILARPPTEQELVECEKFFAELSSLENPPDEKQQWMRFVHALLNHNDFISIR